MINTFESTRSDIKVTCSQAILNGISDDGGLYVPSNFPKIDTEKLLSMNYEQICFEILSKFLDEFDHSKLKEIISKSYGKFSNDDIVPVTSLDGRYHFAELFHGPTLAFKDVALSILPYLITESAKIQGIDDEIVILTATSGDTGKAALEGFANVKNTKILVFYPSEGVSAIQKKQMVSQTGDNVYVIGINGNFDDAQNGVKKIFNDKALKGKLKSNKVILSSANSINIGRLLPQVVYYFSSYVQLVNGGKIKMNQPVNFTVPTGNFGDILAGYYAKTMGLPVNKLICASNSNNVLYDFFKTGSYDRNRTFIKTMSPSMDILISSNFERLLYHASNNDSQLINSLMDKLTKEGKYNVDNEIKEKISQTFFGSYCDELSTKQAIKEVYQNHSYVMDTHTAVAYKVYNDYVSQTGDKTPNIILSTASPYKFVKSVYESIFGMSDKDEYQLINDLSDKTDMRIPKPIRDLINSQVIHRKVVDPSEMKTVVEKSLL